MGHLNNLHHMTPNLWLIVLGAFCGTVLVFWVLGKLFTPKD